MLPEKYYKKQNLVKGEKGLMHFLPKPMCFPVEKYRYVLQYGETLFSVGDRLFGTDSPLWVLLLEINDTKKYDEYVAGDEIFLPSILAVDTPTNLTAQPKVPVKSKFTPIKKPVEIVQVLTCDVPEITVGTVTDTRIDFTISTFNNNALYFLYQYSIDNWVTSSPVLISYTGSVSLINMPPDTDIKIKAKAICSYGGESAYCSDVTVHTDVGEVCDIPAISVFNVQSTSFQVQGLNPSDSLTGYLTYVQYKLSTDTWSNVIATIAIPNDGINLITVTGLLSGVGYTVRAYRRCSGSSQSGYTAEVEINTPAACGIVSNLRLHGYTSTSAIFYWTGGVNNQRWRCTVYLQNTTTVVQEKIVAVTNVTFTDLPTDADYYMEVTPDCTPCSPGTVTTYIMGTNPTVDIQFNRVRVKTHNEFTGMSDTVAVNTSETIVFPDGSFTVVDHVLDLTHVYDERVLKLASPAVDDFTRMLTYEYEALKTNAGVDSIVYPIHLYTVVEGANRDTVTVRSAVNPYSMINTAKWHSGGTDFGHALKLDAAQAMIGTASDYALARVLQLRASKYTKVYFQIHLHFVNTDLGAVTPEQKDYLFNNSVDHSTWITSLYDRIDAIIGSTASKSSGQYPDGLIITDMDQQLCNEDITTRNNVVAFIKNLRTICLTNTIECVYDAGKNFGVKYIPCSGKTGCPVDELFSVDAIIGDGADALMLKAAADAGDFYTKSHFVAVDTVGKICSSSYVTNVGGSALKIGHLDSNLLPAFTLGNTAVTHDPATVISGAGYFNNPYAVNDKWLPFVAASSNYIKNTLAFTGSTAHLYELHIIFKYALTAQQSGVKQTLFNIAGIFEIYKDTDDKLKASILGSNIAELEAVVSLNTLHTIEFTCTKDSPGYSFDILFDAVSLGGAFPVGGADSLFDDISDNPDIWIGCADGNIRHSSFKLYEFKFYAELIDLRKQGGHYLLLDKLAGIMTEWELAKGGKKFHPVCGNITMDGEGYDLKLFYDTVFNAFTVPDASLMKAFFDRMRDFKQYVVNYESDAIIFGRFDFNIREDVQKEKVLMLADFVKDVPDVIMVLDSIDSRHYRQLNAKLSVNSQKLIYPDIADVLLGSQVNGKLIIGYAGNIQNVTIP